MKSQGTMKLTELVSIQMHRDSADELSKLDKWEKLYLADALTDLRSDESCLSDWNELLGIITGGKTADTVPAARNMLMATLNGKV